MSNHGAQNNFMLSIQLHKTEKGIIFLSPCCSEMKLVVNLIPKNKLLLISIALYNQYQVKQKCALQWIYNIIHDDTMFLSCAYWVPSEETMLSFPDQHQNVRAFLTAQSFMSATQKPKKRGRTLTTSTRDLTWLNNDKPCEGKNTALTIVTELITVINKIFFTIK